MSTLQKWLNLTVGVTLPLTLALSAMFGGPIALVVLVVVVLAGWRYLPGFWRTFGIGLISGALAGALLLGPGFRLAMRVVAIFDIRRVEFTLGGTFFIILGIGVIVGGLFGIAAAFMKTGMRWRGRLAACATTVALVGLLLLDPNLRAEFVELGAGPWLNIPMFALVTFGYALFADKLIDRFDNKKSLREARVPIEVPT
ncbi:MAG: hypothetical protein M3P87_04785 [Actinomycetota bacterium]|nr:hypothetical protein [Actinomycetota bacterium]